MSSPILNKELLILFQGLCKHILALQQSYLLVGMTIWDRHPEKALLEKLTVVLSLR